LGLLTSASASCDSSRASVGRRSLFLDRRVDVDLLETLWAHRFHGCAVWDGRLQQLLEPLGADRFRQDSNSRDPIGNSCCMYDRRRRTAVRVLTHEPPRSSLRRKGASNTEADHQPGVDSRPAELVGITSVDGESNRDQSIRSASTTAGVGFSNFTQRAPNNSHARAGLRLHFLRFRELPTKTWRI